LELDASFVEHATRDDAVDLATLIVETPQAIPSKHPKPWMKMELWKSNVTADMGQGTI